MRSLRLSLPLAVALSACPPPPSGQDAGCPSGQVMCGSQCVDTTRDHEHCGACGAACAQAEVCSMGACGLTCGGGALHCGTS